VIKRKKVKTTQVIEDVVNKNHSDRILVGDLVESMEAIGFGLVMLIFSLGVIIPLPPPIPNIIAIPLLIFSMQMIIGFEAPRLPKKLAKMSIKRSIIVALIQKSSPYIWRVEKILRPRLSFMISDFSERILGVVTFIFSIFILIPIPLTNFIPGLGIVITSFGLLGKDGLIVIFGIIIGFIGVAISATAILIGVEAFSSIKNFFI